MLFLLLAPPPPAGIMQRSTCEPAVLASAAPPPSSSSSTHRRRNSIPQQTSSQKKIEKHRHFDSAAPGGEERLVCAATRDSAAKSAGSPPLMPFDPLSFPPKRATATPPPPLLSSLPSPELPPAAGPQDGGEAAGEKPKAATCGGVATMDGRSEMACASGHTRAHAAEAKRLSHLPHPKRACTRDRSHSKEHSTIHAPHATTRGSHSRPEAGGRARAPRRLPPPPCPATPA